MADLTCLYSKNPFRDTVIQTCVNNLLSLNLKFPDKFDSYKLTDLIDITGGTQPPKSKFVYSEQKGYVRFLQIRDFSSDGKETFIPEDKKNKYCKSDDILLGRYGASVGKILTGKEGSYNVACAKVTVIGKKLIKNSFLFYLLHSTIIQEPLRSNTRSAQGGFNKRDLSQIIVTVPELELQDDLVKILKDVDNHLLNSMNILIPEKKHSKNLVITEFTTLVNRILENCHRINDLTISLNGISTVLPSLHQSILQEAVQGKLVQVDREAIKEYVLGDLLHFTKNGYTGRPNELNAGIKRLGIETVTQSSFIQVNVGLAKYIDIPEDKKSKYFAKNNDLFVCRQNGNLHFVGKAAVYSGEDDKVIFSDSLIQLRIKSEIVDANYLAIFINSKIARTQLDEFCSTTAGNFSINGTNLKKVKIPVPSLVVQQQIVKKVITLIGYCDDLVAKNQTSKKDSENLMQTVLQEAFEG